MKRSISILLLTISFKFSLIAQKTFIEIPETTVTIGNDKFNALRKSFTGVAGETEEAKIKYFRKEHKVFLNSYSIKKYLVTNGEFQEFLKKTNYKTTYSKDKGQEYKTSLINKDYPVTHISFFDAIAYCQWKSDITGKNYRLPTNAEWEYAAIGNTKNIFPWGNKSKILSSTKTDSIIGRENFSVYQIKEDVSWIGMANLMGGIEYTLDCYDESFYENSPFENPLCLIPVRASCVMRGISDYNRLENDVYGLYDLTGRDIDVYNGYSYFRLVEANETVFNKNTIDESIYNPKIAKADQVKLYTHPVVSDNFSEYESISDVYILFEDANKKFYRCFVQVYEMSLLGTLWKVWKIGWVKASEIELTSRKWYEN